MITTYRIAADTIQRAIEIARSRAAADGWQDCTVVRSSAIGAGDYEVEVIVTRRR